MIKQLFIDRLRTVVFYAALLCAAYLAGFFLTYAYTIMPGLATTDDRTFVAAFQGLERMYTFDYGFNWPVAVSFFVGPVFCALALVLNRTSPAKWWIAAAFVCFVITMASTFIFNVPSNEMIIAAGDPNEIDVAQARADFNQEAWRVWNLVRSATSAIAFGCLLRVQHLANW